MAGQGPLAAMLAAALALPASCDLPRDPHGTRNRVMGGTLAAALVAPALTAAEDAALARLAADLGAEVEAVPGDVHAALAALDRGDVDVVLGGVPRDTPLAHEAALTNPMGRGEHVMLLRRGENALLLAANRAIGDAEAPGR